ncbi:MAG: DUF4139 domain-containing protein [Terracidiphilus sp.]|jgi:hypothetical protein
MRRSFAVFCLFALTLTLAAQAQAGSQAKAKPSVPKAQLAAQQAPPKAQSASPQVVKDLPVRKVVLYKNGVGYFEHAGSVTGNQRVTIDFTSPQLNDVLQSLTVLDEGGGRIAGVNYNSTTPLAEQLKTLSLGMTDDPTSTMLFQALRGQRVEVTGGPGGTITGRLLSIETRSEKVGNTDNTVDKFYLSIIATSGAARVIELTPSLSVRPLDANLQGQLDRYLELLSTTHSTGLRHLTLDAVGQGQRQLRVSYISEVPVWKSTYRIVFPRTPNGNATMQGWAVVDNTVGADWDNVQLSLVAGAPQSFIQPLSQPIYTRRVEIPIATEAQLTPQTYEAAEEKQAEQLEARSEMSNKSLFAPSAPRPAMAAMKKVAPGGGGGGSAAVMGHGYGAGFLSSNAADIGSSGAGGIDRASDAFQEGDVSTNAFDDFFEYALTQPVTIHKNESAMVPILQAQLPAMHVTMWSEKQPTPMRTVWLENKSNLTLDSGSFSIFESGEFAGEGLLEPIHPGEKRLLSYAADQAVKVHRAAPAETSTLRHIAMHQGVLVQQTSQVTDSAYTVNNTGDEAREVLIEHARRANSELDSESKPEETTATAYRFRLAVKPHESADLHVRERALLSETVFIKPDEDRAEFLIAVGKITPSIEEKLRPLIDAETALSGLNTKIEEIEQNEKTLAADEDRARANLTALKGSDAAKRFVDELNSAEDQLQAARKQVADLEQQKNAAVEKLNALIAGLSFDWDVK